MFSGSLRNHLAARSTPSGIAAGNPWRNGSVRGNPAGRVFRTVAPAQSDSLFLCYSDPVSKSLAMIERRVALFAHLHVNKDAAPEMYRLPIQAGGFLTLT